MLFTAIIFRVKYGQELSKFDKVGCFLIVACVILISIGATESSGSETQDVDTKYLLLAVVFALSVGVSFSINTTNVNYIINELKFNPDQMNYDGNLLIGLVLTPFFVN